MEQLLVHRSAPAWPRHPGSPKQSPNQLPKQSPKQLPKLRRVQERGWDRALVHIAFGDCRAVEVHSDISAAEAQAAVLRAVESWNEIALPIKYFVESPETAAPRAAASSADIVIDWQFASSDAEAILNGQVHAHADYPPPNTLFGGPPLPLHFNADMLWGNAQPGCFDIETVALHELAHLLGLIYHSGPDTILYDAIGPAPHFVQHQLDSETIERAQSLYH